MPDTTKEIVQEYVRLTNSKIDSNAIRTDRAISTMAVSITDMSKAVQESSRQLARYEERQSAQTDRINRIETAQVDQGKKLEHLRDVLLPDITHNSIARKAVIWLACVIVAGCLGGGITFLWWLLRGNVG